MTHYSEMMNARYGLLCVTCSIDFDNVAVGSYPAFTCTLLFSSVMYVCFLYEMDCIVRPYMTAVCSEVVVVVADCHSGREIINMSGIKLIPEGGGEAIDVPNESTVIGRGAFLKVQQ